MERKAQAQHIKAINDRTVTGIFAVHGNVDGGNDRSHPGSFAETTIKGRDRTRFLWMHNSHDPPIAVIDAVQEIDKAGLPPAVFGHAPDATGGVEVTRTYLDTPRGNEVLAGIRAGAIDEMSYAYDLTRWEMTQPDGDDWPIREIYGVRLWDISDVTWGMNPATVGVKDGLLAGLPFADQYATVRAAVAAFAERMTDLSALRSKDGRALSTTNTERVLALRTDLDQLAATIAALTATAKAADPALYHEFLRITARLNGVPTT